jgi:hypothetical protein
MLEVFKLLANIDVPIFEDEYLLLLRKTFSTQLVYGVFPEAEAVNQTPVAIT